MHSGTAYTQPNRHLRTSRHAKCLIVTIRRPKPPKGRKEMSRPLVAEYERLVISSSNTERGRCWLAIFIRLTHDKYLAAIMLASIPYGSA